MIDIRHIFIICAFIFSTANAQLKNPHHLPYHWETDTTKHDIKLSNLTVATAKDALPTLDFPVFISFNDSRFNFYEYEPVIVLNINGETKAYPISLLTMYELSNDSIGGKQVMVTFCPMCNSPMVFNRKINNRGNETLLTFAISGLLMHNDMIMYDRQTESWWEQLMGGAIAGEFSGTSLEMMSSMLISVKDYFDRFPDGKILSPDGLPKILKEHGHNAFHHLEHHNKPVHHYYLPEKVDPRLPPLEHVLDVHLEGHDIVFPFHVIAEKQIINDSAGHSPFVIFYHGETVSVMDEDDLQKSKRTGSATVFRSGLDGVNYTFSKSGNYFVDDQTASVWDITGYCRDGALKGKQLWLLPHSNHFAFAYLAFFPGAEIYGQ